MLTICCDIFYGKRKLEKSGTIKTQNYTENANLIMSEKNCSYHEFIVIPILIAYMNIKPANEDQNVVCSYNCICSALQLIANKHLLCVYRV